MSRWRADVRKNGKNAAFAADDARHLTVVVQTGLQSLVRDPLFTCRANLTATPSLTNDMFSTSFVSPGLRVTKVQVFFFLKVLPG